MNNTRIPTGRALKWHRFKQWLLNPSVDVDMSLLSFGFTCWGLWLWYFGVTLL